MGPAQSGEIVRRYIKSFGFPSAAAGSATVIGSSIKAPVRFAAFGNAVGIHADDYDDTQLAVAENRTYGLLMHPTAPVLSAALAFAESRSLSGQELLLAGQEPSGLPTNVWSKANNQLLPDGRNSNIVPPAVWPAPPTLAVP